MKRVVFDIETEPFSLDFKNARTTQERIKHAPSMRLACLFNEQTNKYFFFLPTDANKLISHLKNADEVISFNGKEFDLLVLCSHHSLSGNIPERGKHIDMCEIMTQQTGFRVSLHKVAKLNLGRGKHTLGRNMRQLDFEGLKIACRSDVIQTYELWKLYSQGNLNYPEKYDRRESSLSIDEPGPYNPVLDYAEIAGFYNPEDLGEMSDGEQAEYFALLEGGGDEAWASDMFGFELMGYRKWQNETRTKRMHKSSHANKAPKRKQVKSLDVKNASDT